MSVGTYSERMAEFTTLLRYEDLPASVLQNARLRVLEVLGLAFAGYARPEARVVAELMVQRGGNPESTVIGFGVKVPASNAALANGAMADALEYGDTHRVHEGPSTGTHPALCVVPAALAVAERVQAKGTDLITACVAGLELAVRVARAAPMQFFRYGFHTTAVCSVFGAAAAAGYLMRLSARQLTEALGICLSFASGTMEYETDGSRVKQLHDGWQASAGIFAAELAGHGMTGPHTVFEGKAGLFRSHIQDGRYDLNALVEGLGERWETPNILSRAYPLCNQSGPFIEAAVELKRRYDIPVQDIEAIECDVARDSVVLICEPLDVKRKPTTAYGAKYSLPYAVGLALANGRVHAQDFFEEHFPNGRALELASKVSYTPNPERFSESGLVRIRMRDGSVYEYEVPFKKGSLQNPMTDEEVVAKYKSNMGLANVPATQTQALLDRLLELDHLEDVGVSLAPFLAHRL